MPHLRKGSEFGQTLGYAPDGSPFNQLIDGDEYYYQQEWSNKTGSCKQRVGVPIVTPQVSKLSPTSGLAAGGTSVTITGTGFTGASAVNFGSTPAASFKVNSWTSITAVSPPGTSGFVEVTVTTTGGTNVPSSADLFKYKPPTVTGVSPNTGPRAGGTSVTITGSGFALGAATTIKFAGSAATGRRMRLDERLHGALAAALQRRGRHPGDRERQREPEKHSRRPVHVLLGHFRGRRPAYV